MSLARFRFTNSCLFWALIFEGLATIILTLVLVTSLGLLYSLIIRSYRWPP
jgi:hypothetical protein